LVVTLKFWLEAIETMIEAASFFYIPSLRVYPSLTIACYRFPLSNPFEFLFCLNYSKIQNNVKKNFKKINKKLKILRIYYFILIFGF